MELPDRRSNLPDLRTIGIHPDYWYPVALARELKPRATLAVSFAGEPVVLARTDTGDATLRHFSASWSPENFGIAGGSKDITYAGGGVLVQQCSRSRTCEQKQQPWH
jgi:hypothetical protein